MLAVLEAAVSDLQKYATVPGGRGRRLFAEARAWFASNATEPFDFEHICQALELEPSFIRSGLARWGAARPHEPCASGSVLRLPLRRTTGTRQRIAAAS